MVLPEPTSVLSSCSLSEFLSELRASSVVCFCMRLSVSSCSLDSSSVWECGERGVAGTWEGSRQERDSGWCIYRGELSGREDGEW